MRSHECGGEAQRGRLADRQRDLLASLHLAPWHPWQPSQGAPTRKTGPGTWEKTLSPQIATPTINSPSSLFLLYFRASLLGNRHLCSACLSCLNYLYSFENGQVYSKDEEEILVCSKLVSEPTVGSEAHPASSTPADCLCGLSPARKGTSSLGRPTTGILCSSRFTENFQLVQLPFQKSYLASKLQKIVLLGDC